MKLTKEQKEILSHTIKNGFYCGEESKELDELCAEGLKRVLRPICIIGLQKPEGG